VREGLRALVPHLDVPQSEEAARLLEKSRLLADRLDAGERQARHRDAQGKPGEAGTAPDVDDALAAGPDAYRARGERIEEVLHGDSFTLGDRCEVHGRIAFDELVRIPLAHPDLRAR